MLRLATMDDLPALCALGRLMHEESSFAPLDYDVECVKATIARLLDNGQLVLVATDATGEVVGGVMGSVAQTWFGRDMVANDLALFVHPAQRGGLLAARLMRAFVAWARLAGAKQVRLGVTTGSEAAQRLYEGMGFRRCGAAFVMEGD